MASNNIYYTYLTLYVLAVGASRAQVGLMSSLSNPGAALLVEHFRRRKEITMIFGGGIARLMLLLIALIPFGLRG